MTISPTPGDVNYWRNHPVMPPRGGGDPAYPYRISGGAGALKIKWGPDTAFDVAGVSPATNWYLNVRLEKTSAVDVLYSVHE